MPAGLVVLILALTLGIQPVTSDLYLPALPSLSASFAAPMWQAQYTLSAMLLAFGCSQLIWGPLSDRFGRRPVLLTGLLAYTLAALASTQAPSMLWLIVWRALQGAAMGAVVVCARAIVRDLYAPTEGARIMSKGLSGLGVLACLAPPVGSLVSDLSGWRMTLLVPALFSAGTLALVHLCVLKKLWRSPTRRRCKSKTLVRTWTVILRNPTFLAYSIAVRGLLRRLVHVSGDLAICVYPGAWTVQNSVWHGVVSDVLCLFTRYLFVSPFAQTLWRTKCRRHGCCS